MGILAFISAIFKPAAKLIDNVHTSEEERKKLRNEFEKIQASVTEKAIELDKEVVKASSKAIQAEAASGSFLATNWRPMTMLAFVTMIISDHYWPGTRPIPSELWNLITIGIGGYVGGRSAEKITRIIKGTPKVEDNG